MRKLAFIVFLAVLLAAFCPPASAEEKAAKKGTENLPWDKAAISLGSFISSTDSNIRLSAKGLGVGIDVEEALGLDTTSTVFRLGGTGAFPTT